MSITEIVSNICDELKGTCMSISEVVQHHEEEIEKATPSTDTFYADEFVGDLVEAEMINQDYFCCECCAWWCEVTDASETEFNTCKDCTEE